MGTFDWTQYLVLAQELKKREGEEACLRSSISRAYYSAYHLACKRLRERDIDVPSGESGHKGMWDVYRTSDNKDCRKIGGDGDRLRNRRKEADYDDNVDYLTNRVLTTITTAENIQGLITDLPIHLP